MNWNNRMPEDFYDVDTDSPHPCGPWWLGMMLILAFIELCVIFFLVALWVG